MPEPKLKHGIDSISANVGESKWAVVFKQAIHQKLDPEEDVQLDDPDEK